MMKWPFSRKKKDDVPAEIQEYYQAERRERVGVAWVVALLTLLVTVAVVLGLFFGGRWVYRKVANRDSGGQTTTTQTEAPSPQPSPGAQSPDGKDGNGDQPASPPPAPTTPQPSSPDTAAPNPAPAPTSPPLATNPGATPQGGPVPSAGPGDVVAVFAGTSALAALAHRLYWKRRY